MLLTLVMPMPTKVSSSTEGETACFLFISVICYPNQRVKWVNLKRTRSFFYLQPWRSSPRSSRLPPSPSPLSPSTSPSLPPLRSPFSRFIVGGVRSRKCGKPKCKGMKKAMEFDIQLQTEECLRSAASVEIDELPWKGWADGNPDYECLRSELRRMAPLNGRAILLFKARCGCPVAKLEAWGPKRGCRHKKCFCSMI